MISQNKDNNKDKNKDKKIYLPDEILSHICQYCDRYQVRTSHKKICAIIERMGTTHRIMTKHWQGPFEDEFIEWWESITIPYKVPTWNSHCQLEPLDLDSCLSLPPKEYTQFQYEMNNSHISTHSII